MNDVALLMATSPAQQSVYGGIKGDVAASFQQVIGVTVAVVTAKPQRTFFRGESRIYFQLPNYFATQMEEKTLTFSL